MLNMLLFLCKNLFKFKTYLTSKKGKRRFTDGGSRSSLQLCHRHNVLLGADCTAIGTIAALRCCVTSVSGSSELKMLRPYLYGSHPHRFIHASHSMHRVSGKRQVEE
jgi:hypothetical protein